MIKLPRNKNKVQVDYKSDDIYKFYKNSCKEDKTIVDKHIYMKVLKAFMKEKFNHMIYDNIEYILPARLGSLKIKSREIKLKLDKEGNLDKSKLSVDYAKTLEVWRKTYPNMTIEEIKQIPDRKIVYHLNDHSDGKRAHFYWDKITCNLKNQSAYRYQATRTLKRTLANVIKTMPNIQYYE